MPKAAPDPTARRLPDGIEVFRAGTRTSDDGTVYTITPADLAASAAAYSAAVHEAPLTVGHPKDNLPAYGWVSGLQIDGDVLKTSHRAVEPAFAEMVAAERFKKRSASFYHPRDPANPKPGVWYLRHVAWLGAQPPAVKGLKDVQFSAGDAGGVVSFSEPITATHQLEPTDMSKELEEQLAKAKKETEAAQAAAAAAHAAADEANKKAAAAQAQAASFAEKARADRKAGFVSFADAQVKAGTLLPKDKDMAVATLEALADSKPVEFAEGDTTRKVSPAQWLQDLIAGAKPQVSFGEFAGGGRAPDAAGAAKGKTDAEIHQAAQAWMASHKGVSYAEALGAVTSATFTG